jgi:DNA-binding MarR family transcriptional regulator
LVRRRDAPRDSEEADMASNARAADPTTQPRTLVPDELLDRLDYLFCKVAETIKRRADESFTEVGLRSNHHTLLRVLGVVGPLSQQDIAAHLLVDPSTVVDQVDQLEARGLLLRTRNPADRRANLVSLTAEGRRWLAAGDERAAAMQADLFSSLKPEDHARLHDVLKRLAAELSPDA